KDVEKKLEKLNDQKGQIEGILEDPTLYMVGMNAAKVKSMQISLAQLEAEIDKAEEEWLELSAELETAQR
ncbi:MAG: ABC transporter ATP-binding protein, partial [Alphaproteobacteria bacterium]|nr:ABC transporter ATP-binding protein [Alphaproteobacteria bacterium]